jgi:hypothetical protein
VKSVARAVAANVGFIRISISDSIDPAAGVILAANYGD